MPENLIQLEKKTLQFWQKNKIFEKSLQKKSLQGDFIFYDGPPFATGTPHYGHIVASLMKDIVPRFWTMKGYHVERKWGWDCHGLPIENIVEKEKKLNGRKEIEKIGIDKFNEACRSKVMIYAKEWRKVIERMGRWVDMDNDYKTMDKDFMESVWWVFKQLWDKELIYLGYKSMHICPRCETTLSQSEVSQGYLDIKDWSGIFKFELVDEPGTYLLAWTTTPWTLPGNVALAVGEGIKYVKQKITKGKHKGETYIYCLGMSREDLRIKLFKYLCDIGMPKNLNVETSSPFIQTSSILGKELAGKKYKPLFDYYQDQELENKENLYTIQLADFVSTEEGTGIVHIAPAFGEDDLELGKAKNLPFIQHVEMDGKIKHEVKDFAGLEVKPKDDASATDLKILEYLDKKGLVFSKEEYEHSYPHCWRCDTPLLNYATSSWFIKVTILKKKLLEEAEKIHWVPAHVKQGRFGKWLEGAKDWCISRQRFWGSVMPVWQCEECQEYLVFGSIKELEEVSGKKIDDLHKHFVDKIELKCPKCKGKMFRIPDVLDCWFESASMPYAQVHYPFENKEQFEKNFPAQFIAEGVDQTRAWFYYLHVLSVALKDSAAFQNVVANGIVLAEDGKKMSKKLNNYPDPMEVMDQYGADAMRYYLATASVMRADDLNFSSKGVQETYNRYFLTLSNVLSFYQMYQGDYQNKKNKDFKNNQNNQSECLLDQWILAKLEQLKVETGKALEEYDLKKAAEPIGDFILELSTWYLRRSRNRFKENSPDAFITMQKVFLDLSKIMAPFTPFIAEHLYQSMGGEKESVHLDEWPPSDQKIINQELLSAMAMVRKICEIGHSLRAQSGLKVRQPLEECIVIGNPMGSEMIELIKDELNVKQVLFKDQLPSGANWEASDQQEIKIALNTELSEDLKNEGRLRELSRQINSCRKKASLTKNDQVKLYYQTENKPIQSLIEKNIDQLKESTASIEIIFSSSLPTELLIEKEIRLGEEKIKIGLIK